MGAETSLPRRDAYSVLRAAELVGTVSAIPATVVALYALGVTEALAKGTDPSQAWRAAAMTDEDWEMVPSLLFLAVLLGALVAAVSAVVWVVITDRVQGRSWVARLGAAAAAAVVPILLLVLPNWRLGCAAALSAGLIALVAAPRVGYGGSGRSG